MPLPTYAKPMPKFKKKDQKVGTTKNSIILCLFCSFFLVFIVFSLFLLQITQVAGAKDEEVVQAL
jgi:hypothetical protein